MLRKLLQLVVGIGGGAAFEIFYDGAPKGMGVVVGLLLYITWEVFELATQAKNDQQILHRTLTKDQQALHRTLTTLAEAGALTSAEQVLIQLGLTYAGREISRADTSDVWNQLSWAVQSSYRATNYIDIEDLYKNNYAVDVLAVQMAKRRALKNFSIKKVFISDRHEELTTSFGRQLIREHAEIEIKSLLVGQIDPGDLTAIGGMANLDFAIFDKQVVLIWRLRERKIVGSVVLVGSGEAEKFDLVFEHLFKAGGDPPKPDSPSHHGKGE